MYVESTKVNLIGMNKLKSLVKKVDRTELSEVTQVVFCFSLQILREHVITLVIPNCIKKARHQFKWLHQLHIMTRLFKSIICFNT